jgi:Predicted membrane protein
MTQNTMTKEQQEAMRKSVRTQMTYLFIMILLLFVYTTPIIRYYFSLPMFYILQPVIGFNYQNPIITIFLAALITALINSGARHFFMDYFKMAEIQHRNRKFSQQMREAIRRNDKKEIERIRGEQMKYLPETMNLTQQQMKPTYITLLISVLIFAWLINFMFVAHQQGTSIVKSPFGVGDLMKAYYGFYLWILLYTIFSFVLSYPIQYVFRLLYLKRSVSS